MQPSAIIVETTSLLSNWVLFRIGILFLFESPCLYISEVREQDLKSQSLNVLWLTHASVLGISDPSRKAYKKTYWKLSSIAIGYFNNEGHFHLNEYIKK